jgi:hypothetical protein
MDCPIFVNMLAPQAIAIRDKMKQSPIFKSIVPDIFEYFLLSDSYLNNIFYLFFYSTFVFHVTTGELAKRQLEKPKNMKSYAKLEGIQFTEKNLWMPPGTHDSH